MRPLKCYFFLPLLLISFFSYAQQHEITGTVTSISDGFPLPGVLVESKSTKLSTLSDVKGQYKIQLSDPENDILVFTFMGFLIEEVAVKSLTEIDVALSEDIEQDADSDVFAIRFKNQERHKKQKQTSDQ